MSSNKNRSCSHYYRSWFERKSSESTWSLENELCYVRTRIIYEVTQKILIWVDEGQKELADNQSTWEWIKYNIRAHAIQFSKRRAKEKRDKEKCLQNEYTLASKLYKSDPCHANANLFHAAKEKLELFYEEKTKGIIIRARARWYEHGEKSTKYFLNLEKRNHIKKHMRKLIINESVTTDSLTILSEQKLSIRTYT